ncbi:MAG: type II toxin-antitoxin system VapB family antitoxin [Candidatus Omnitrophota bacterium]|nr:type II toxin-antitoxin system VapB family antitoxin [Candidatus Omnitrophota bacterium]
MSRTNIDLDDKLVREAMAISHCKTKKQVVSFALKEFVKRLKRKDILRFMGTHCWQGDLGEMRRSRV